jgi:hypothetical protein
MGKQVLRADPKSLNVCNPTRRWGPNCVGSLPRLEGKVSLAGEAKLNIQDMTDEELPARIEELTRELGYVKREDL